jgi:pantoate--beta-alanine ligase
MKLITDPKAILEKCLFERMGNNKVGFVPTMGALHEGHLSLVRKALIENDLVVASIFVNPLQFNDLDDFDRYPQNLGRDKKMLEEEGCHILFLPENDDFFKEKPKMTLQFGQLDKVMESQGRPGHFNGVGIIVSKLFHFVQPHRAYFGLKDLQQFLVIKMMVRDLNFDVEIIACPTIREKSGMALSSRNLRLSDKGKKRGLALNKSLYGVLESLRQGFGIDYSLQKWRDILVADPGVEFEYLEIGNMIDLSPVKEFETESSYVLCGALKVEGIRLIDNLIFKGDLKNDTDLFGK